MSCSTPCHVARLLSSGPGTMPATWAELRSSLSALLDHFATACSTGMEAQRVLKAANRWQDLTADLPPLPPVYAERAELLG